MPDKCCIYKCRSNYDDGPKETVFFFPGEKKDNDLRQRWIKFVNREDWKPSKKSCICRKHFEPKYYKTGAQGKRYRLLKNLKPVPTIFDPEESHLSAESKHLIAPISVPRKPPTKRIYQEDQLQVFQELDKIKNFKDIDSTLTPPGYTFQKYDDHVVFYRLETNVLNVPEVTACMRVDRNLHVKLFYKGSPLPLPQWFRHGRDCRLTRKSMMQNFPSYIRSEGEQTFSILEELKDLKFQKKRMYSSSVIRYSLLLRYTSLQTYRLLMKEFPFPSLSLLKKITEGKLDAVKCATTLKSQGAISEDIVLMFDEMYLQKCEEYSGGEIIGANENNELYKGLLSFMIVGLKENVPYIIKSVPELKIGGNWIKEQILDSLNILKNIGFRVRAIVSDNHSANVLAYKLLLKESGRSDDDLFIEHDYQKIYLLHDAVHLIKNVRNNLLNYKRFVFPGFEYGGFKDTITFQGGDISWKLFHDVFEKDSLLDAHLRKAPKMTHKVLHPGNCKQNVSVALAIFHETTSAALTSYFPEKKNGAEFLKLFNTWWLISNSKVQFSNNIIGHAAKKGDGKPEFCRALANWIENWSNERAPSFENFTFSLSTAKALIRTLRCQASLIEDLLDDGYDFILTARFQSEPLERQFGQYRQMSGGRFLVGLKDTIYSERILKIKSLLKEDIDIDEDVRSVLQLKWKP